ncbi:MAG: DoxX family protein [Flavicella sp.]
MEITFVLALFSGLSFVAFGLAVFVDPFFIAEFKRYGLASYRKLTGMLQLLGAFGLFAGFLVPVLSVLSTLGLSLLMFLGFCVRLKIKDGFLKSFPSFFYMALNAYLFWCYYNSLS